MTRRFGIEIGGTVLAAVLAGFALSALTTQAAPRLSTVLHSASAPTGRVPVVVELFTSEGCSSCPPADTLLSHLETQPVPGVDVIALGEHVDYWNHGGWADRFSSPAFSARQNDYSRAFGLDNVYTPQMIVDGKTQFVGSDDDAARTAIARAARSPKADVTVTETGPDRLSVSVGPLPPGAKGGPSDVYLAITEDGLSSSVGGGENAGRRLAHGAVVRQLTRLGTASSDGFTATPTVTIPSNWHRESLRAVIFVQERVGRGIVGAASIAVK